MPVTHDALVARRGLEIGIAPQEVSDFRLDRLRQQGTRTVTQNLSERIAESPWLSQLDDVSVGHGVSLLWWRSGGLKHPHDTPPYPFMPSPTSAHSSSQSFTGQLAVLWKQMKIAGSTKRKKKAVSETVGFLDR